MKDSIKSYRIKTIAGGFLLLVLGAMAFFVPENMLEVLGYIIGGMLILAGVFYIVAYLLREATANVLRNDFVWGLGLIIIGVVVFTKVKVIVSILPVILGILVIISGCIKLQNAIDMKRLNGPRWIWLLILAIVNLAVGIVLIVNPFGSVKLLFRILGIGLMFSGLTDILDCLILATNIGKYVRTIETSYTEIKENESTESESKVEKTTQMTDSDKAVQEDISVQAEEQELE